MREDNGRRWDREDFKEVRGKEKEEEGRGQNGIETGRREGRIGRRKMEEGRD